MARKHKAPDLQEVLKKFEKAFPGLTDEKKAKAYPAQPGTLAEKLALAEETAKVRACSRSGNQMTFECWEEQPALDIPVIVEVYV